MIKPINDSLLIEVVKKPGKTKSGVVRAQEGDNRMEYAKVIAVASTIMAVKKGDYVYFKTYSLTPVVLDSKEYNFLKFEDILAIQE